MAAGDEDRENHPEGATSLANRAREEDPRLAPGGRALHDVTRVGRLEAKACKGPLLGVQPSKANGERDEALGGSVVRDCSTHERLRAPREPSGQVEAPRLVIDAGSVVVQGSLASCRPATNSHPWR
jgi:hypothetical protein